MTRRVVLARIIVTDSGGRNGVVVTAAVMLITIRAAAKSHKRTLVRTRSPALPSHADVKFRQASPEINADTETLNTP